MPANMFIIISLFLLLFMRSTKLMDNYNVLTGNIRRGLEILLFFSLTFWLISFSAVLGPYFFKLMDYNVTNVDYTITAFDATNCLTRTVSI